MALNNLGSVQTLRGEIGAARASLSEALSLAKRIGNRRRLAFTLAAVATLAAIEEDGERAVRLDAVASDAVAELGASLAQPMYALNVPHLELARQRLGAAAAEASVAAGRATTFEQAVDEVLAWLAGPERSAQVDAPPANHLPRASVAEMPASPAAPAEPVGVPLSRRRLEVAALIGRGFTNRQIADELVITEGTAANHVKAILASLGFESRVQVAVWATERGLHERSDTSRPDNVAGNIQVST
jgi:ATP/maltotriose-dependent transcriptional regulator MalT